MHRMPRCSKALSHATCIFVYFQKLNGVFASVELKKMV